MSPAHRPAAALLAALLAAPAGARAASPGRPGPAAPAAAPAPAAPVPAAPDWAATITDSYSGREWNAGVMACTRIEFSLRGGALVGHYWVGDKDPFEGELTDFIPAGGHAGLFTWNDRDGQGAYAIRFAEDGQSFTSQWGDEAPDPQRPGWGRRGPDASVPGCNDETS